MNHIAVIVVQEEVLNTQVKLTFILKDRFMDAPLLSLVLMNISAKLLEVSISVVLLLLPFVVSREEEFSIFILEALLSILGSLVILTEKSFVSITMFLVENVKISYTKETVAMYVYSILYIII